MVCISNRTLLRSGYSSTTPSGNTFCFQDRSIVCVSAISIITLLTADSMSVGAWLCLQCPLQTQLGCLPPCREQLGSFLCAPATTSAAIHLYRGYKRALCFVPQHQMGGRIYCKVMNPAPW